MDTECGEQASAPAQLLEALQTAPFCWLTAPNCKAGEVKDTDFFFLTLKTENVPRIGDLSPTFKVFDFK